MVRPKLEETPEDIRTRQRTAIMIRVLRSAMGLNQRQLSERVGLSFSGVAKLEDGTLRLNTTKLTEIFAFFEEAGLSYTYRRGKISVTLSEDTVDTLLKNDLMWPADGSRDDPSDPPPP
jgi:transcriptional regulator with XRE-family HTH domain